MKPHFYRWLGVWHVALDGMVYPLCWDGYSVAAAYAHLMRYTLNRA